MAEGQSKTVAFESSLKDLEKIVAELEKGDLPLEKQLKSFEKGVALSRQCMERLEEMERRVEKLIQTPTGSLKSVPYKAQTESPSR